jgi:hypothetical protein
MSQPAAGPRPIDPLMSTLNAAAEQGRSLLDSSFRTCAAEVGAFFEELAKDNAEAANEVSRCRTPFEVLAVQQKWLAGRAEAYINAGLRMALGAVLEPEAAAAEEVGAWRLPE